MEFLGRKFRKISTDFQLVASTLAQEGYHSILEWPVGHLRTLLETFLQFIATKHKISKH
jgi:hypothetical protein